MTNYCQLQRGFFTLQVCNRPAYTNCVNCGRPVCQFHVSLKSGLQSCIDCAQKQNQQDSYAYDEDEWLYSYRNRYYNRGYQPHRYDRDDYRSFESDYDDNDNDNFDDDDNDAGDFSDS